jgi:hypothetical protein
MKGSDNVDMSDAVRLPNALSKPQMKLTVDPNAPTQQMMASPTQFLT